MNEKKYALVTGASSGIGRELSKEFAQLGYHLIAVSKSRNSKSKKCRT